MKIEKILLLNFRSYEKREFDLEEKNLIIGGNGAGKSNLVEALYLLATGKSFRADKDDEMIRYGEEFFRIMGQIGQMGQIGLIMSGGRKKFEVNGVSKQMMDFVGKITAVMFGPADMDLVTGSPGGRRRYLDFVISQKDREYRRSLLAYEKALRQRNKLLDFIREGSAQRTQLFFWDRVLIKDGQYMTQKRQEFLDMVGYEYDRSVISEARLKLYEKEEVAAGSTLVGPHRDDFVFINEERDVSKFGSRGEQRMAVWWLKQKEIEYLSCFAEASQDTQQPLLLLDDIFSELDHEHRKKVIDYVKIYKGQVVMTTADEHLVSKEADWNIIRL